MGSMAGIGFTLAKLEIFHYSSCIFRKFPIFALANSGEIDLARESAFFALFLDCESSQFILKNKDNREGKCFRCCVIVSIQIT